MASYHYGGQALIEGVLMRGRNALAVALRHPDGSIVWATERLDLGLRARRALKLPFLRGLVVLYDTLVTGTRWLVRSATLQAVALLNESGDSSKAGPGAGASTAMLGLLRVFAMAVLGPATCAAGDGGKGDGGRPAKKPAARKRPALGPGKTGGAAAADAAQLKVAGDPAPGAPPATSYSDPDSSSTSTPAAEQGLGSGYTVAIGGMLALTLVVAIGIFFLLPLLLAQATVGRVDQGFGLQLSEGVIRVVIFIGYLVVVAQASDVRRTFQYHGAEHMSIHTLESGDPLTTEAARKYPTAHPRCGTEFLVVVLIVSILAFAVVGRLPLIWLIVSRVVLIPIIAAISYELLQLGARHRSHALVRWLWSPGIWVQAITTRQPTDDMIEVAIVSLEKALIADGRELPEGSAVLACRPLNPDLDGGLGVAAPAAALEVTEP